MATNRNVFRRIFVVERDGGRTSTIGKETKETVDGISVEETEGGKFVVVIQDVYGGTHSFGTAATLTRDQANDFMLRLAEAAADDGSDSVVSPIEDEQDAAE